MMFKQILPRRGMGGMEMRLLYERANMNMNSNRRP
jgi:hypothetical protein